MFAMYTYIFFLPMRVRVHDTRFEIVKKNHFGTAVVRAEQIIRLIFNFIREDKIKPDTTCETTSRQTV